ncbi:hypothetical protein MKJ04_11230 [Pontibacter sp. E15-1]|uniref:hypothetical protein n=1 Tax=Pontibacter sp. E15-1 TaxID=2919918 RepID=UPI001F501BA5|nr:hypothetical protein [Pontibacter sp. E15-1]MCJ8165416.1 hypothetical protein [Pontibacter sp. E15-1]
MRKSYLLPLLLILALTSCNEGKDNPEPEAKAVSFNFRLDPLPEATKDFELILSQKDGKVLLDTMLTGRTSHALTIKSNDTKFDVTTVYQNPNTTAYSMRTYIQVNPDGWHIDEQLTNWEEDKSRPTVVNYTNVNPFKGPSVQFGAMHAELYRSQFVGQNDDMLRVEYNRQFPTDLTYLLLPEQGKYIFAEVTSPVTYVDFSNAATAVKHKFINSTPDGVYGSYLVGLYGYPETGNEKNRVTLYVSANNPPEYDLQYPPTGIKEFLLIVSYLKYQNNKGYRHDYYHIGPTIPTELPFIPEADFSVAKSQFNDFQIQFAEDKPSTYSTMWSSWENVRADWVISVSPEETAFNPQGLLEKLRPTLLKDKDLSGFRIYRTMTRTAKGYTHQTMNDYLSNPEAYLRMEPKQFRNVYTYF